MHAEVFQPKVLSTDLGAFTVYTAGRSGPWVVCWPTVMSDHRSMLAFAEQLLGQYRIVLVDPPGIGANNHIGQWPNVAAQTALAHQVVDALGIGNFHWVGHGYGGLVGAGMLARVGYRMQSITLSNTHFLHTIRMKFPSLFASVVLRSNYFGRRWIGARMGRQMATANAWEHKRVCRYLADVFKHSNLRMLAHFQPVPLRELNQLRKLLEKVRIPKLLLAGALDNQVLPRDQATLADVLQARYEVVYSGYGTFYAKPADCAYMVSNFWNSKLRFK